MHADVGGVQESAAGAGMPEVSGRAEGAHGDEGSALSCTSLQHD